MTSQGNFPLLDPLTLLKLNLFQLSHKLQNFPSSNRCAVCLNIVCRSSKSCDLNQRCSPAVQNAPSPEEKHKLLPKTSLLLYFCHTRLLSPAARAERRQKFVIIGGLTAMFSLCLRRKSTTGGPSLIRLRRSTCWCQL